jgi:hypothetical protein
LSRPKRKGKPSKNASQEVDLWTYGVKENTELGKILTASTVSSRWEPGKGATEVASGALYRLLVYRDEEARTETMIESAMKRAIAERLKDTLEYRVTLKGHADATTGAIYSVDTMIDVNDSVCDVHEQLWIASRTLRYSGSDGPTTELVCWRPESFVIG